MHGRVFIYIQGRVGIENRGDVANVTLINSTKLPQKWIVNFAKVTIQMKNPIDSTFRAVS